MFLQILALSVVALTCLVAFRWGGTDERLAAVGFILAGLASNVVTDKLYTHTESGVFIVDVVLFFGLLVLALRSDRFWPMWAAAFQLVGTMVHVASISQTGDFRWAYFVALIFWTYPVVLALMAGTWFEVRGRREQPWSLTAE